MLNAIGPTTNQMNDSIGACRDKLLRHHLKQNVLKAHSLHKG